MARLRQGTQLGIKIERRDPCLVLFLAGELDIDAGPLLERRMWRTWDTIRCPGLIVDLTGIVFCDSCGAAALIRLLKRVRRAGGRLIITGMPRQVQRRLRLLGVLNLFTIRGTVAEALGDLWESAQDTA